MRKTGMFSLPACALILFSCGKAPDAPPAQLATSGSDRVAAEAIIADVEQWVLENDLMIRAREGLQITELPDTTLAAIEERAAYAGTMLDRIAALDLDNLENADVVALQVIQNRFESLASAPERYWLSFDVTPYASLFSLYSVHSVLPGIRLSTPQERDTYLNLVDDYADIIEHRGDKTARQAERGIRIPKPAIPGVRTTVTGARDSAQALLVPAAERLADVDPVAARDFLAAVRERTATRVVPAYERILAIVDSEYEVAAPEAVGMSQYPEGDAVYRAAVRESTSYDIPPEDLHERGLASLEILQAKMQAIRRELGFEGSAAEFHAMLRTDSRFIAESPAQVEDRYMGYIRMIEPHIDSYFELKPAAPYGVKRLDPANEPGQTFGYYQMPSPAEPRGLYRYNGSRLDERPLVWAQGLIYHELIPGHHFQIALHAEREDLPVFMRSFYFFVPAYTEGWAEYASSLGMEMGLYKDPYDRYGRYLMESFLATRLVVDTGMNLFGWPLEKARQFMRDNTFASETEIRTETLRYSTDIPAQALGYRFGSEFIWQLRRAKEAELGDAFDIKTFHNAVLGAGALPMWVLEQHVDRVFDQ